ncbi:hypothetical protein OUZ56_008061 [Daphnia magna]|uniref:Uncharacterized protein n=1 Tax=Daphnia magna TaxID=35525 RepID=A0ABR0ABU3_9CRUS|nr:hypothetical protein OUZ56_008061 [Daphnia magna]
MFPDSTDVETLSQESRRTGSCLFFGFVSKSLSAKILYRLTIFVKIRNSHVFLYVTKFPFELGLFCFLTGQGSEQRWPSSGWQLTAEFAKHSSLRRKSPILPLHDLSPQKTKLLGVPNQLSNPVGRKTLRKAF